MLKIKVDDNGKSCIDVNGMVLDLMAQMMIAVHAFYNQLETKAEKNYFSRTFKANEDKVIFASEEEVEKFIKESEEKFKESEEKFKDKKDSLVDALDELKSIIEEPAE